MHSARHTLFALAALAMSWPAQAQVFPDIASGTVIGRLTPGVGQPEQVPLSAILKNTTLPSGQIWIGSAANLAAPQAPSGDWTISVLGVATLTNSSTARSDLGLGNLATQNAGTGLGNSGSNLNLQPAAAGTIGGVNSITSASHQWIAWIDTAGLPHQSQPAVGGISGFGTNVGTLLAANASGTSWACSVLSNATAYCSATVGQLPGTTTNDNASAGNIGEFVSSSCPDGSSSATITVTIASPAVVTWTGHNFKGTAPTCPIVFTTSNSLPTGITASTTYWTIPSTVTANTFEIATSITNALAGTPVNTSGSQSGTQTGTAGAILTSPNALDVTALSLTAGDWQCSGAMGFNPSGSVTQFAGWFSTSSATLPNPRPYGGSGFLFSQAAVSALAELLAVPSQRFSLSGTTTVYADDLVIFSTGSTTGGGFIGCRRAR